MKHYLNKKDLSHNVHGLDLYTPGHESTKNLLIRVTSGTTGTPTVIIQKVVQEGEEHPYWLFPKESFVRLNPNNTIGLFFIRALLHQKAPNNVRGLFFTKKDVESTHLARILESFKPTIIHATPTYLQLILQKIYTQSVSALSSVSKIILSSELTNKKLLSLLKERLPNATFPRYYAMSEMGFVGMSCPQLEKEMNMETLSTSKVHPLDSFTIEILDADENNTGEIVMSRNGLEHYKTGDAGKLEKKKCSCGKERTLTIYGRSNYDIVHCVGATIHAHLLEELFETLSPYVKDFLVEVREKHSNVDSVGELTFNIVPTETLLKMSNPEAFIVQSVASKLFVTKTKTLTRLIEGGIFLTPTVVFIDSLPSGNKKTYLRKIVA